MYNVRIGKASNFRYEEDVKVSKEGFFDFMKGLYDKFGCDLIVNMDFEDIEEVDIYITIYDDYLE